MRDVVQRAMEGDRAAFGTLAAAHVDGCYALAYRIVRDQYQAQDAAQQALIGAWRDLPTLRDPDRFEAWLYRLVVNACYVELRSQRRRAAHFRVVPIDPSRTAQQGGELDGMRSVADRDALEHAFGSLTAEQRAVVVSHHYLGYSLVEIAENLGIPVGTARSRLHYAVRRLRTELDADAGPPAIPQERLA